VPVGKAGYNIPRTLSSVISTSVNDEQVPVPISNINHTHSTATPLSGGDDASFRSRKREFRFRSTTPRPPFFGIGGSVIPARSPSNQPGVGEASEPERPVNLDVPPAGRSEA
jgi:hypothetical protein